MIQVTLLGLLLALIVIEICVFLGFFLWEAATDDILGRRSIIAAIAILITAVITYAVGYSPLKDLVIFTIPPC